tara:strand:+ start:43 stop:294 length:252 start_codon:yes stop_codon:yes gene_type:complete
MTNEELIAKAKKDYPIGTVYNSTGGWKNCIVCKDSIFLFKKATIRHMVNDKFRGEIYRQYDMKWAEIIAKPQPKEVQLNYEIY